MAVSKKVNHGKKRKKRSVYQQKLIDSNKRKRLIPKVILTVVFGIVYLLASVVLSVSVWYQSTFDLPSNDLSFTTPSLLGGAGESALSQIFSACTLPVLILLAIYVTLAILLWKDTPKRRIMRRVGAILCIAGLLASLVYAMLVFRIPEYLTTLAASDVYKTSVI